MTTTNLFHNLLIDLEKLETLTELKIQDVAGRNPRQLVQHLQEELDPMARLEAHTLELAQLTDEQKADLQGRLTRWSAREYYLAELLEQNLGYIDFLRQLLGLQENPGLNLGL